MVGGGKAEKAGPCPAEEEQDKEEEEGKTGHYYNLSHSVFLPSSSLPYLLPTLGWW